MENFDLANIDLSMLDSLEDDEKQYVIEILKQYALEGKSDLYDQLKEFEYDEKPVNIHTFMHDKRYLGNALYDAEGRFTVFPYWEKCLEDIFPDEYTTKYNNIVFTGAIGLGKSTIAVIILLYMLHRLLCLKDPYQYYGLQSIDKLSIAFMNITIENAKGVALDKWNQMILSSEWFLSHGEMHGTTNLNYVPEKHIEIICGSNNNHVIGRCIFASFEDEVNFATVSDIAKAKARMLKLITQIDARMRSRFLRGTYLPTVNIIASSKDSEQSFLEDYIDTKKKNNSKTTLIVDEPQWVVDSRKDSPVKFYVAIGDKMLANELLPLSISNIELDEYINKGYQIVKVPIGYLETFQQNLDEAICSIIGIATASTLKYLSGPKLTQIKTPSYRNPFVNDIIEVGNAKEDLLQYSNFFDLFRVSPEDRARPMFVHLDMSITGDKTGIAGVWITGKEATVQIKSDDPNSQSDILNATNAAIIEAQSLTYKTAFSVSIKAPKGAQVSFEKNRLFVNWLREQGFNIVKVSSDTFQSAATLQHLQSDGFETEIVSVDRLVKVGEKGNKKVCLPYHNLKTAIYERRLTLYEDCKLLTEELLNLEKESDGHIQHPENGKYGCFTGDTKVSLTDGRNLSFLELIDEFNAGKENFVYSFNHTTKRIEPKKILKAWKTQENAKLMKIVLDNDEVLRCTLNHKFMIRDGSYIEAQNLMPGDSLMPLYIKHKVKSIEFIDETEDVYDITVEDNHNFALSAGVFVHNSKDQADALCGCVWLAGKYAEEYAKEYGEDIKTAIDVSMTENEYGIKSQLTQDFEQALAQIMWSNSDLPSVKTTIDGSQIDSMQQMLDIADGLVCI